jgi:hypothetical protein
MSGHTKARDDKRRKRVRQKRNTEKTQARRGHAAAQPTSTAPSSRP